ncbi:alpha/beta hydrolase family protein [Tellurirhabdus bombi]|uniref:alpha/beta hydrolase family protein n=1 Tax=Tellurirhabdus bombi TaxID=2907205 RepID=UPI001F35CD4B|nr:alpha/beta hydrolase family protein [Tellurirhabdus bombi]
MNLTRMSLIRYVSLIPVFLFWSSPGQAQDNSNALSWKMNTAYNAYLMRDVHQQFADRKKALTQAMASKQAITQYRDKARERYRKLLGNFGQKTDLRSQVVGTTQYDGFRIERIIFESVPNRHVTANLYIPTGKGPFPATLILSGHGMSGKVSDQKTALAFVLNGIAALAVDPIGQGERVQLADSVGKALTRGSTTEHTLLNVGSNLVGMSVAAYEYWDNMRALDYLETRQDVDKNRLGCIGSSGGGTQTTYLIGLDDRIKIASVCSYVSQRERTLELSGPSDGCQHIPYEGREHLEIGDFLVMFAPKPLLIMSGYYDFVDYWSAARVFDELKGVYGVFGEKEKVGMFSLEGGHGMPKPKREAAVTWFRTWFFNDKKPVKEKDMPPLAEKDLLCTTTGQCLTAFAQEVSIPEANYEMVQRTALQRADFGKKGKGEVRAKVMELLGIELPKESVVVEATGSASARNYTLKKYQLIREGQMPVPCLVLYPEAVKPNSKLVVLLNENGKSEVMASEKMLESFVNRGEILVLADLRGFGETSDPAELNDTKYWNREYRNAMISLHTGKPIMGQRVIDLFSVLDFINADANLKNHTVKVVANGAYGPAVVHAAYLDQRIGEAEISRSIKTFAQLVQQPMQRDAYSHVLYGVLGYYDLPDLVRQAGSQRVRFVD